MRMRMLIGLLVPALTLCLATPAMTATAVGNFNVRITITAACLVTSATDLDFGSRGVLAANFDATNTIGVQCTTGTPYTIALGVGNGAGATVATRYMTGPGSALVAYALYRDAAHTQIWGTTAGTDTVAGTGNGAVQNFTVYGRVPPQTTPAPGDYADVVAITVTY